MKSNLPLEHRRLGKGKDWMDWDGLGLVGILSVDSSDSCMSKCMQKRTHTPESARKRKKKLNTTGLLAFSFLMRSSFGFDLPAPPPLFFFCVEEEEEIRNE